MQITKYQIKTKKINNHFTIALVADLHGKPYKTVIDSLVDYQPDYIAIVGDVVNCDNDDYPYEFFKKSVEITTTFLSLGNHERKITDDQISRINSIGVIVLDNTWVVKGPLVFGGMTSAFVTEWRDTCKAELRYANPEYSWLGEYEKQPGFRILLDHHPEDYERITKAFSIDLILSGHAHGGQIRIMGHGLYAPHQGLFPKYTSGVHDSRLVVSRGLANNKLIPRLWNPIELVYIDINGSK